MIGDYTIYEKSMNGVKTLSDGISMISDGIATHENIYYTEYIKSNDEKTILLNDSITTETINALSLNADNIISSDVSSNEINCNYFYVHNVQDPSNNVLTVDGNTNKMSVYGTSEFLNSISVVNVNISQTQSGTIQQTGTGYNNFKDTKINGYLEVGSNITQTGGSTVLKDLTVDDITQTSNSGITQSGSLVSNSFGSTSITNLTVTNSITLPNNVSISGTTTTDDIIMNDGSVITQDITYSTTKFNKFLYSKFLDIDIDGSLNQTKAGATATLKNTTIQGSLSVQGDITQTTGSTVLKTINCNNITLNVDNDINMSGTGKLNQSSGSGENILNAVKLNSGKDLTLQGTGKISQASTATNVLGNSRSAGYNIVQGKNNTTNGLYQNIANNNGLHLQFNRDNSTGYSFLINHKGGATGNGGFRFQRYNGSGVYIDEPIVIEDEITFNKNLNIVGYNLSCASATLGNITQTELNTLDNNTTNIKTKFDSIDTEIANLQSSASSLNTALSGITFDAGTDTTTIDNNLLISSGKTLTLGTTNVNSFITDTNTFLTATTNTLQGIVYTGNDDTTTINNNVNVTGNLIVQGMNIKAEIDALDTSFTTGTINSTNITAGNLTVNNSLTFNNATVSNRNLYGLGYLYFGDLNDNSNNQAFFIGQYGVETAFVNNKDASHFSFSGKNYGNTDTTYNKLYIVPSASASQYNATTINDDILILGHSATYGIQKLNITVESATKTGCRIEPTKTTISGGDNNVVVDASNGVVITGSVNIDKSINNSQSLLTRQNNFTQDFFTTKTGSSLNNANNTSGSGTYTHTVLIFSVTPNYNKQIQLTMPISVVRTYTNDSIVGLAGNNFTDTITNITYTIYKNNQVYQSGNCITTESLPRDVYLSTTAKTSNMTYEFYMTNAKVNFYCEANSLNTDTYEVDITVTYSYTITCGPSHSNFIGVSYAYVFNTDIDDYSLTNINIINDQNGNPVIGTIGTTYTSGSYTLKDDTTNYFTGQGELWTNKIISNSIRTQNQIETKALYAPNSVGLYCFNVAYDTPAPYTTPIPFFCSVKNLQNENRNSFDWFILFPRFRVKFYKTTANYTDDNLGYQYTNNTNSTIVEELGSDIRNNAVALRLYRLDDDGTTWSQITVTGISTG